MSSLLDRLADRAQQVIDVLRNRPGKELDLLTILELGEGALRDPEAETTSKTIASDETQISDESDDEVTVIMASSTPRISKSLPTSSGEAGIHSMSSITPKTSRKSTRIVKSSPTSPGAAPTPSNPIKATPATSGESRINSTPSNPIKTEPESPRSSESSRKRSEVVVAPSPAVKKRRSGPKGVRHPFLGIDNQKMWEFVIETMNSEIDNNVNHSAKNLAKGIDIWDEFYDKYDDPSAEYENMHTPASLQTHFCRIFEDLPTCEYMDADTKLKFLNHSKYRISEEFRRQLEKDTKSRIICDKDGVIVKVQPNVVILVDSDESEDEEEELPETDPE